MAISDNSTAQIDERFSDKFPNVVTEAGTSITLGKQHWDAFVVCSAAGAVTVTIPESTSDAGKVFPIGTTVTIFAKGAGGVTIAKTGADVLTGTAAAAQNICRKVTKVAATEWVAWV
jgi:hypothetical protein